MTTMLNAQNPSDQGWHSRSEVIGLGLGIIGVGFALAEIYNRPSLTYIGIASGIILASVHWNHHEWGSKGIR